MRPSARMMTQTGERLRPTYARQPSGTVQQSGQMITSTPFVCALQRASSNHIVWKDRPISLNSFTLYVYEDVELLNKDLVRIANVDYEVKGDALKEPPQAEHKIVPVERKR